MVAATAGNGNIDLNGEAGSQQLATLTEATINQDGQLILTGEDGTQGMYFFSMMADTAELLSQFHMLTGFTALLDFLEEHGIFLTLGEATEKSWNCFTMPF